MHAFENFAIAISRYFLLLSLFFFFSTQDIAEDERCLANMVRGEEVVDCSFQAEH